MDKQQIQFEIHQVQNQIDSLDLQLRELQYQLYDTHPNNICPKCRKSMLAFSSYQYRQCIECGTKYEWTLKAGQLPLIRHQR